MTLWTVAQVIGALMLVTALAIAIGFGASAWIEHKLKDHGLR